MTTTVVRIRRQNGVVAQDCDVYIGRACNMGGWRLSQSIWRNPFSVKEYGRAGAIAKYRSWVLTQPHLIAQLPTLKGQRLGCWCAPAACHGDVLAELANAL